MKVNDEMFKIAKFGTSQEIITYLKKTGEDVNQVDAERKTIAHHIASRRDLDKSDLLSNIFDELKNAKMNFNIQSKKGTAALHHAISYINPNAVKNLLKLTDLTLTLGKQKATFLHQAIECGEHEIIKIILTHDIKTMDQNDPLNVMLFKTNSDGLTPIAYARSLAKLKDKQRAKEKPRSIDPIIQVLVENGFDVPKTSLNHFIVENKLDDLEFQLAIGADPNMKDERDDTLLHVAVGNGNPKFIDLVLSYSPDLEAVNDRHSTVIDRAAAIAISDYAIRKLIEAGASVEYVNTSGNNIVHTACCNSRAGHLIINYLFEQKKITTKHFEAINNARQTPLHLATARGNTNAISALVDCGVDVNKANNEGRTPLHVAYLKDKKECIELLLSKGADPNITDYSKNTPSQLGEKRSRTKPSEHTTPKRDAESPKESQNKRPCLSNKTVSFFANKTQPPIKTETQNAMSFTSDFELQKIISEKDKRILELTKTLALYQEEIIRLSKLADSDIDSNVQKHFQLSDEDMYNISYQ